MFVCVNSTKNDLLLFSNGFPLLQNNEGFVQFVSLNICPHTAHRRLIRKFH